MILLQLFEKLSGEVRRRFAYELLNEGKISCVSMCPECDGQGNVLRKVSLTFRPSLDSARRVSYPVEVRPGEFLDCFKLVDAPCEVCRSSGVQIGPHDEQPEIAFAAGGFPRASV